MYLMVIFKITNSRHLFENADVHGVQEVIRVVMQASALKGGFNLSRI